MAYGLITGGPCGGELVAVEQGREYLSLLGIDSEHHPGAAPGLVDRVTDVA
jgi:hypothetical protein